MENLGNTLRDWVNTVWKPKDGKFMNIFDKEFEKATKDFIPKTPEGQIRFGLLNRRKLITAVKMRAPEKNIYLIREILDKKIFKKPFYCKLDGHCFPPYSNMDLENEFDYTLGQKKVILFYANNIENNPNCAKDLITYWFETYVLKSFEHSVKNAYKTSNISYEYSDLYCYSNIRCVLQHFGIELTRDEYQTIFTELCNKYNVKLKEFDYDDNCYYGSFYVSL